MDNTSDFPDPENTLEPGSDQEGLTPEELDRAPFKKGEDPDNLPVETSEGQLMTSDTAGKKTSGNTDRTFLDRDEEEEKEDDQDNPDLEDEEEWPEEEITDEDADPYMSIDPDLKGFDDDDLELDEDGAEDDDLDNPGGNIRRSDDDLADEDL